MSEDLSGAGKYSKYRHMDLRVRANVSGQLHTVGCMSPCKKLTDGQPWGESMSEVESKSMQQ